MEPDKPPHKSPYVISKGMKFPKDGKFITGQLRAALREGRFEDTVIQLDAGLAYCAHGLTNKLVCFRRAW